MNPGRGARNGTSGSRWSARGVFLKAGNLQHSRVGKPWFRPGSTASSVAHDHAVVTNVRKARRRKVRHARSVGRTGFEEGQVRSLPRRALVHRTCEIIPKDGDSTPVWRGGAVRVRVRGDLRAVLVCVRAFVHDEALRPAAAHVFRMAFRSAAGASFREKRLRVAISFSTRGVPDQRCCREPEPASMLSSLAAGISTRPRKKWQIPHVPKPVQKQCRLRTICPPTVRGGRRSELSIIRGGFATVIRNEQAKTAASRSAVLLWQVSSLRRLVHGWIPEMPG